MAEGGRPAGASRRRRLRASLVTTAPGLVLAVAALAAAQLGLPTDAQAVLGRLLAAATIAALVAGAGVAYMLTRTLHALDGSPDAGAELAGRLPGMVARSVVSVGSVLGVLALADAARRDAPGPALWAGGAAMAAILSTLAVTAMLGTRAAVRRRQLLSRPPRGVSLGRRHTREAVLVLVGAVAPAASLALGAGGPPLVIVVTLGWLVVLGAGGVAAVGAATEAAATRAVAKVSALEPSAGLPVPAATPPSMVREARLLEQAVAQLGDRVTQQRLTQKLAVERSVEADRLRTQFLANTSHDLRSPLHAVLGYTELLLRGVDGELTAAQVGSLERVRDSGGQLLHIVQEVLDLARIDAGRLDLVRQPAIAAELVEQSLEELRKRYPLVTIEASTRVERGLPMLTVDQFRVVQALVYLAAFAMEAAMQGTPRRKARLQFSARRVERAGAPMVELGISAPDAALPEDEHRHLFDGFRLLATRSGLGLGPHLARRFVELHGGDVVASPPGAGLRFDVLLPAPQDRPAAGVVSSPG